jgi:hypothetical protein
LPSPKTSLPRKGGALGPPKPPEKKNPFFPAASPRTVSLKEVKELAAEKAPGAIEVLWEICKDEKQPGVTRVQAANALLDRGLGKPMQNLTTRVIQSVADLSDEELDALLASEGEDIRVPDVETDES